MSQQRHVREIILLILFLVASFGVGVISFISSNQQVTNTTSAQAATNWDSLCRDGVYYVKNPNGSGEIGCGRAPNCDDTSYGDTAGIAWDGKNGACWVGSGACGPACKGFVPLCCYKMAESGNAEDCAFPERKYCRQDQCKKQTADANCGSGINDYCVKRDKCLADRDDVPIISLEDRVAGRKTPSGGNQTPPTNTPVPPTDPPTQQPQNTPTQQPNNPTVPAQATPTPQSNSGITPVTIPPTQTQANRQPTPTDTFVFDFGDNDETGNFEDNPQVPPQQNNNNTTNNSDGPLAFSLPQIELKSPKQVLRETVDRPAVEKLNQATEKPLSLAKDSFVTIRTYDKKLEDTVEGWLFKIRVSLTQFFK